MIFRPSAPLAGNQAPSVAVRPQSPNHSQPVAGIMTAQILKDLRDLAQSEVLSESAPDPLRLKMSDRYDRLSCVSPGETASEGPVSAPDPQDNAPTRKPRFDHFYRKDLRAQSGFGFLRERKIVRLVQSDAILF